MTINCQGQLVDLSTPAVMGILNFTPDSFYDGGYYQNEKQALIQVEKMLTDGATFIDIGGQSTRPGAAELTSDEEAARVVPLIQSILKEFPQTLISIDTFHSQVARKAVEAGAVMVNDISGGNLDKKMMETVAQLQVPYIMMHMRGTPKTMQSLTDYKDLIGEITSYFSEKIDLARSLGINDVIIDPGFGFAKTIAQNFELLKNLSLFKITGVPLLMGVSRKSSIYKVLKTTPDQALNGTTVLNTIALLNGANILRVHDVKEARECIELIKYYNA